MEKIKMKTFILGLIIFLAVAVVAIQFIYPYAYLAPDSFTYFTMARQVYETGKLFSFSGVDYTTGIHPGFYFFLIPFYPWLGINLPAGSLILGALLLTFAVIVWGLSLGWEVALVLGLGFLTPYGLTVVNSGMESSLALLGLALATWFIVSFKAFDQTVNSIWARLGLGATLGLMVFARLDLIFVALAILAVIKWRRFMAKDWSLVRLKDLACELALIILPLAMFLALAMGLNFIYGQAWLPISGALKSSFPHPATNSLKHLGELKIFFAAVILTLIYLLTRWLKQRSIDYFILSLWLANLALWFYNGLFASGIGAWYGAFPLTVALLSIGLSWQVFGPRGDHLFNRWPQLTKVSLSLIALVLILVNLNFVATRVDWVTPHAVAARYLSTWPAGAAGELKDGVFAFYAQQPVFSLTGLANNRDYVTAVKNNHLKAYLDQRHILYVVGGSIRSGVQVPGHEADLTLCREPFYNQGFVAIFKTSNCF